MTATTTTIAPSTSSVEPSAGAQPLWKTGLAAGAAAAVATTAVAAIARGFDVPIETAPGEAIPIAGFAQLTLFFTAIGVLLARVIRRRAGHPRSTFTTVTVALTVLSCVPDLVLSTDAGSKLTLVATHLVAAAIVIPALASRLPESR